jgi:signal transduction histidine kinase
MKLEHKTSFTVDAALLKELGEKLIGQPAIALGELVKNSYDADAASCRITLGKEEIVIADDGHGMSEDDFLRYWMRIGTTHKVEQGTSRTLHRPLTGSKGIGRLSAQFLADEMILESATADEPNQFLYAIVDWRNAVKGADLNTVNVDWEMRRRDPTSSEDTPSWTRITLQSLKNEWDVATLQGLGNDVWMLRSPFRGPVVGERRPEDFVIEVEAPGIAGAREAFDKRLQTVFENWKARIRGALHDGRSGGRAVVSVEFRAGYPEGSDDMRRFRESVHLPIRAENTEIGCLLDEATFEILVFKPEGKQPGGVAVSDLRDYLAKFGNVSVYNAGFRLPYYGSKREPIGEDWLSIAADQARRLSVSELLPDHLRTQNKYMLDLPAVGRIFGAVEINTNREREAASKERTDRPVYLELQSGRDRLTHNQAFYQLRDLVRFSLDYYANRFRLLDLETVEKEREAEPPSRKYDRAIQVLEQSRSEIPGPVFYDVRRELTAARKASALEEKAIDRRAALLAPLASAGMAALALNHEIVRESRFLDRIGARLRSIATKHGIEELKELAAEFNKAKRRLESLQELFAPLLSDMDRSATDRLKVRAVVEQTVRAMRALMPGVKFDLSRIPGDLRFPIGSLADWNALLQNVLSNAWNAMLDTEKRELSFHAGRDKGGKEWLHISDTGVGLDGLPDSADKLFEPFERRLRISDDKRSIALGGQGLGLAIVRMIAHRRSANVSFVSPEEGFSTTFEIAWRGAKK